MVAQQFLVLFVVVRIRLGQHNDGFLFIEEAFVVLRRKGKIVVVRIRLGQRLRRLYRLLFLFCSKKSTISPSRRVTRCGVVG